MEQSGQLARPITSRSHGSNPVPAIMKKIWWASIIIVILLIVISFSYLNLPSEELGGEDLLVQNSEINSASIGLPVPVVSVPTNNNPSVDFQKYNVDYMNDNVKAVLVGRAGSNSRTVFYLPPTGYINVSRGTKYGVAHLINNVNPKVPEGSEFSFSFNADASVMEGCGVSVSDAQDWIERGQSSTGVISGQWREDWNEWYDTMTIYFAFPEDVQSPCNVKYNYEITKDGHVYDSRQLEFNVI